jgi:tripartite-type tricarboxylate transporter receptor subunit TctC
MTFAILETNHLPAAVWVAALALCSGMVFAAENSYPARPIRVLIPFPAGGVADTIGRTLGEQLNAQMGQPIVIDNRPGAGGRIAAELLAKSEADGYTLFVSTAGPLAISPALMKNLPYDAEKDFQPVTRVAEAINVMVVNPSSGVRNVKEFVEWAKKRAGNVRYGSSGTGQPDHLSGEFFQRLSGLQMIHVPYKGGGPALVDVVSGDLQVMFATYAVAVPHVKGGRLRVIAVTTPQRQALLPDLPTVGESLPGFAVSNWNGVFVPAKTPALVAERLFVELNKALKAQSLRERQHAVGIEPAGSATRAEFGAFMRADAERWRKIIRDANVKVE